MEQLVRDVTARLTPLGVMVLALLREGDMHPYEMMRLMRHRHDDQLVTITNGTFYHTVARLERQGLLAEVGVDRDGNRPERTTYTLTDAGRDAVSDWVRAELPRVDHPAEFRVALAESHNLDRAVVIDLLSTRRAALTGEHLLYRDGLESAQARAVPEQFLVQTARQAALLAAELAWLDDLIQRLEQSAFPWGVDELPDEHFDSYQAQRKAAQL
jgi:DNA-binding PadR family transcriptional regulator